MKKAILNVLVLLYSLTLPLIATAVPVPYDARHTFRIFPGGNVVPTVTALTFQHAWVHDPGLRSAVTPAGQPAGFKNDGREFVVGPGFAETGQVGQFGLGVKLNEVSTAIPAVGAKVARSTANVPPPNNSAEANSDVTVDRFGAGGAVSGTLNVSGFADPIVRKDAYAFSTARVIAQGQNRGRGKIDWRPAVQSGTLAEGPRRWRVFDPISFEMFDLGTGDIIEQATLLEILADGDGTISWDNDIFSLDSTDASFSVDISSPFTNEQGTLLLQVSGGQVTAAQSSGMFAGLSLPSLGSLGTFSMALPNDFGLSYDLDPLQDRDVNVKFDFSGGGGAFSAVPEPATWLLLGTGLVAFLSLQRREFCQSQKQGGWV